MGTPDAKPSNRQRGEEIPGRGLNGGGVESQAIDELSVGSHSLTDHLMLMCFSALRPGGTPAVCLRSFPATKRVHSYRFPADHMASQ